jgi:hypothetical protein
MARRKRRTDDHEGAEPQPMTPDGLLVRGAGAKQGKGKIRYVDVPREIMPPTSPITRKLPRDPYTGEE